MSVIDRALKAAQREKSRRDAEAGRPFAPVLVRLRTPPARSFRPWLIAPLPIVAFLVAGVVWYRSLEESPLPDVPPVTSALLSEALSADTMGARARSAAPPASVATQAGQPLAVAAAPAPAGETSPAPPALAADAGAAADKPRASTASPHVDAAPRQAGTLRIAVEPMRNLEAARLFNEAIAAHRAGDLDRARERYGQVLAIAPNDADALNNFGVILSGDRDFERAHAMLRRAVDAAPGSAAAWNNLGAVLREQGRAGEAIAAYRQAIVLDSRHLGARVGLAQQYAAAGAMAAARQALEEALAIAPEFAEAHYTLGQVQESLGDRPGALAAYAAFIRYAPPRLASHVELVRRRVDALAANR